ncbi:hypothetical protein [Symbiobacterium terraclitae]|uniref:hypothetical protein n=1 Tax=Symbiobacterium terraclitae TaxID=557451 RepID=UPI0035B52134
MILPPYALQAARLIAWAMASPDPAVEEQVTRLRSARLGEVDFVWAGVLQGLSARSRAAGGPVLTQDEIRALVQWFIGGRCQGMAHLGAAKQAVLAEARRLVSLRLDESGRYLSRWVRWETFLEFRAVAVDVNGLPEPAPDQWPAPLSRFPLAAELERAIARGGVAFKALNNRGELELYFLTDSPEQIRDVAWDFGCLPEHEPDVFAVDLAVYVRPGHPLFYTYRFDMASARGRYEAAAFCEQRELRVFAITADGGEATVALCRRIRHPESARRTFRNYCRTALGLPQEPPPPEEVPVEEILCRGTAYQFEPLAVEAGEGLPPEILDALQALATDRSKLIRQGPFTLWMVRRPLVDGANRFIHGVMLILTPSFWGRTRGRTERDPLYARLRELDGFIRAEDTFPLYEGAVPLYRYVDGGVYQVPQREGLIQDLRDLWEAMYQDGRRENPYGAVRF